MKKFNMLDENFICLNCKNEVKKLNYSARNHCNICLYSRHVDIMPGDRLNTCMGLLKPIGIEKHKKTYKIIYECLSCKAKTKNIVANDDNFEVIIELSKNDLI